MHSRNPKCRKEVFFIQISIMIHEQKKQIRSYIHSATHTQRRMKERISQEKQKKWDSHQEKRFRKEEEKHRVALAVVRMM